jgi:hypothetical protein
MKTRALAVALLAAAALTAGAQTTRKPSLSFVPLDCVKGGELALLQVDASGPGEIRAYFRRVNTTDWCSVEGVNQGPLSRVILPRFENGDEIEYFFVLLQGNRIAARSPRLYRSRVSNACETPFARHVQRLVLNCTPDQNAVPSSMAAGMALTSDPEWPDVSPYEPEQ